MRNISAPDLFPTDFLSDDYVRVIGQSTSGGITRYVFSEYFQIASRRVGPNANVPITYIFTNLTFTDIPPRKIESLSIVCTNCTLRLGQSVPLAVLARFTDGAITNLAPRTSWTSYRVSNTNIATVSPNGLVTAFQPGIVFVTAVNEGASAVCGLNVVPGVDGLTTVVGSAVDTNGLPVVGATVRVYDLQIGAVLTDASGQFAIPDVPTTLGALDWRAELS